MTAALCYGVGGGGAQLAFHVQPGTYGTNGTNGLIGVLGELRRFLGGQKATLLWDGLPAQRSNAIATGLPPNAAGWWWSACPPMHPTSVRSRACGRA